MATYKVIQNIEAEDKFVGPLTLKQFIYAAITAICVYLGIYFLLKGIVWVLLVLAFPAIIAGFLAFPWGRDQSTETWLLAKIRYRVKPRVRIWNQGSRDNLVTITAPKKVDKHLIKDLSPTEVKSRLKALAETIDSRGWAIKNVSGMPAGLSSDDSDRLIQPTLAPQEVADKEEEDILDPTSNPLAKKLDRLIDNSAEVHRQEAMASINQARTQPADNQQAPTDYWFAKSPDLTDLPDPSLSAFGVNTVHPDSETSTSNAPLTAEEQALLQKIHDDEARFNAPSIDDVPAIEASHDKQEVNTLKTPPPPPEPAPIKPAVVAKQQSPAQPQAQAAMTAEEQSDKLRLARNNDRSVESIAREANNKATQNSDGEVVISLH